MSLRVLRLGTPRHPGEGLRIGTVRRPPRGVPREAYAARDIYDVWLPNLAPSEALLKRGQAAQEDAAAWPAFARAYRAEMARPEAKHLIATLAALSRTADFSVGCYCADEARCHRSILRELLAEAGAHIAA